MDVTDVQFLVSNIDKLIFSHTGEHLDDLQQAILEGALDHQKYSEIAKKNHRSEKYVKDLAGKLWQTLSAVLGEEVSKSNIKSTLQRYYYSNLADVTNSVQINRDSIYTNLLENKFKQYEIYRQAKLEAVIELINEGLSIEQIARVLKLPLELIQQQIQNTQ